MYKLCWIIPESDTIGTATFANQGLQRKFERKLQEIYGDNIVLIYGKDVED